MSFDILRDDMGDKRETFPLTCYLVAGTQAKAPFSNEVIVMKVSNMNRVKTKAEKEEDDDDDDSDSSSDEEDENDKVKLELASIKHEGGVNRIRVSLPFFSVANAA